MKNIITEISMLFLLIVFLIPVQAQAQAQGPQWWNTNSLKLDSLQTGTLFHAQGTYGFSHMTGNVELYVHQGSPQFFLRNGRFMAVAYGQINLQKVQVGDNPATKTHTYMFNPKLIYDVQRSLQSETGMLWEHDDPQYIDRRIVFYQGLNYNVLENDHLGKMLFGAVGYQWAKSTEFLPVLPVTHEDVPVAYLQQELVLKTFAPFIFSESFSYIRELNDEGVYRTHLTLSVQLPATRHVIVMLTHQTEYESAPIIHSLSPFFEKFNTTFTLGVQFNF